MINEAFAIIILENNKKTVFATIEEAKAEFEKFVNGKSKKTAALVKATKDGIEELKRYSGYFNCFC